MPFAWHVSSGIETLATLAGVRFDRLFTELDAIVEAWTKGLPPAREMFPPEVSFGHPRFAAISYGHINCLGAELVFPEDSEVAVRPLYGSLDEGIRALQKPIDFTRHGMFRYFLDLWQAVKRTFPDYDIPFTGFKDEGPVTTAWLLRGHDFFMDLYDRPDEAARFLDLVTASIIDYRKLLARINGRPEVDPHAMGLADDGAAIIGPQLWPRFVVPYLERYFSELTTGTRHAHIEDLTASHLHFLDELKLAHFDPSVSPRLTPQLLRDRCSAAFSWRMNPMQIREIAPEAVLRWIVEAVRGGADAVTSTVSPTGLNDRAVAVIHAFVDGAKRVEAFLAEGGSVDELKTLLD